MLLLLLLLLFFDVLLVLTVRERPERGESDSVVEGDGDDVFVVGEDDEDKGLNKLVIPEGELALEMVELGHVREGDELVLTGACLLVMGELGTATAGVSLEGVPLLFIFWKED